MIKMIKMKLFHRCATWVQNMRRAEIVPEIQYQKLPPEKQAKKTSTKNLLLCENHFEAKQFNIPELKG